MHMTRMLLVYILSLLTLHIDAFLNGLPALTRVTSSLYRHAGADSDNSDADVSISKEQLVEDLDSLPSLDELLASGQARIEPFRGEGLDDRFHWKTRALSGEFSHSSPNEDTEAASEGSIEAAFLHFPANVTITTVGKLAANPGFIEEVKRCFDSAVPFEGQSTRALVAGESKVPGVEDGIDEAALYISGEATGLEMEIKERSGGKFLSIKCTYLAVTSEGAQQMREKLRGILGSMMVF